MTSEPMTPPSTRPRRGPHLAVIVLAVIGVLSMAGLWWAVGTVIKVQNDPANMQWSGSTPPPAVIESWMFTDFAYRLVLPALSTAVASVAIGLVLVLCLPRITQRATRTMSAAGATVKVAPTTWPNSSPSISNSSGSPSMSSSTERPRK